MSGHQYVWFYCCIWLIASLVVHAQRLDEGDECTFRNARGKCIQGDKCDVLRRAFENDLIETKDIPRCGFNVYGELVCCPNEDIFSTRPTPSLPELDTTSSSTTTTTTTTAKPVATTPENVEDRFSKERPAERACKEYYALSEPTLTTHILYGTTVDLGEYPHMVAIGFSQIGSNRSLVYNCGGTLIHDRFVLTAAHCLVKRNQEAVAVRMGFTNFSDPELMDYVVETGIRKVHLHPDYISSQKYNDIALLELAESVNFTENVSPTCLYTKEDNPVGELHVSGWGINNSDNRTKSTHLLKATLTLQPLDKCNATYTTGDIPRSIERGLIESQLCAFDPGFKMDACQGDSGGPLQLDVDISRTQYSVVGIVSAGFDCGTRTPGLYTRVYSFLKFIEDIVWPSKRNASEQV